jgi:haloacetate dehalogenase
MRLLLARLGLARTAVLAHDGGAQVVLRMALDHPGCLTRIAVVEGLPNGALWAGSDGPGAAQCFVRLLLAQPAGLAERLIGADPDGFVDKLLGGGTAAGSVFAFHPAALRSYRQQMRDPDRLAALCARHRAGAGPDRQRDLADAAQGRGLTVPLHLVCATGPGRVFERDLPAGWAPWSDRAGFTEIESGHFAPEENPEALLAAVRPFLLDRRPVSTEDRRAA